VLIEVKVPALAESVPDATLLDWYKQPGDAVSRGQMLIDLETDKVTLEIAAPEAGVVKEILQQAGDVVLPDVVLCIIDTEGTARASAETATSEPSATGDTDNDETSRFGPAVRKLLEEHAIDPVAVPASGKDGRLTKADVLGYLETQPSEDVAPPATTTVQPRPEAIPGARPEERVPMTRIRKRTAERLLQAQQQNAILTTFNEVNMKPFMDMRSLHKEEFEKQYGVRLGFMSVFVKAAVEALKRFPVVNAYVDGDDVIYHGYYDVGVAVGSERGLVVPIMRDVDRMPFSEIERKIRDFGERARDGKLTLDELTGGTFTISNGGVFGSLLSTPILNPPQSAILGMHKIQDRPVAENGEVVIRPMMYVALSYDHRVIDGADGARFLRWIAEALENPFVISLEG